MILQLNPPLPQSNHIGISYSEEEMIGRKFGILIVKEKLIVRTKKKEIIWLCTCECGKTREVAGYNLRIGKVKSCGCLRYKTYKKGEVGLLRVMRTYQKRAIKTGVEFTLNKEEFKCITQQNCHYCGVLPTCEAAYRREITPDAFEYTKYIYNTIDRVDSKKGYTLENSLPCCLDCNLAKNNLSYSEFLNLVKRIHTHLEL